MVNQPLPAEAAAARARAAEFSAWVAENLGALRAEYEAELDGGEYLDWNWWVCQRWYREQLREKAAA